MSRDQLISLRISELVLRRLEGCHGVRFKEGAEAARKRIAHLISLNFQKERELEKEAAGMMDDLERQGHSFERGKMRPLLKKRLAEKKGFVL